MSRYRWSMDYQYNVFDADEHVVVSLWRLNKKGSKYLCLNSWAYSTFFSNSIAHKRAEKRITKLRQVYDAREL